MIVEPLSKVTVKFGVLRNRYVRVEFRLIVTRIIFYVFVWHLSLIGIQHIVPDRDVCAILAHFYFLLKVQIHLFQVLLPEFVTHKFDLVDNVKLTENDTHHVKIVALDPV